MGKKITSIKQQDVKQVHDLSQHDYRLISEVSPLGMSLIWAKGTRDDASWGQWIFVNPAMCNIVGYTEEDLQKITFMDITHPDDLSKNLELTEQLVKGTAKTIQWEKRYIHKYGHNVWVQQNVSLLRDEKGEPQYFLALTQDISERKKMENQLRENDTRFKLVQKATGDMIWDWDLVHDQIYVSENVKYHFMYDPEYVNSQVPFREWWEQRIHQEDREIISSVLNEAFKKQQQFISLEYRFLRGDGKYAFLQGRAYIIYNNGKPIRAIGANQNITKRKETESALKESEERYSLVVSHANDLISIVDPDVTFLYGSPSHKKILGYEPQELKGINAMALVHPDDLPRVVEQLRKVLKGDRGASQYRLRHKDGHYVTLEGTGKAIMDIYDKPYVIVVTAHDISERIELNRKKNNFIKLASHELKTPLSSLQGMLHLLEKKFNHVKKTEGYFEQINLDMDRLITLVKSLLEESRLEAGELELQHQAFRLDELIKEVAKNLEIQEKESHEIIFQIQSPVTIDGDRDRIGQVFINLLNNAIKFSPNTKKIVVSINQIEETAIVSIQDFGIGISESDQKKIFDPFFQAENAKLRSRMGLGFGLHIASEIIRRHRGIIKVDSAVDRGSTFTVFLPAKSIFSKYANSSVPLMSR